MQFLQFNINKLRYLSQFIFLLIFLFLPTILFSLNPLLAISTILASKEFLIFFIPSIFILLFTLVIGRFFCGWICPLGTILDIFQKFINAKKDIDITSIKYLILTVTLFSSLFGLQLVGFFDPLILLSRTIIFSINSTIYYILNSMFSFFINTPLSTFINDIYSSIQPLLPIKELVYLLPPFSLLLLISIILLENLGSRFWCRNLCPLGALFSIFSQFSLLNRLPSKSCNNKDCCLKQCQMKAFNTSGYFLKGECNLCLNCTNCNNVEFKLYINTFQNSINFSRRAFIFSAIFGVFLAATNSVNLIKKINIPTLIRPPGALGEEEFLKKCIRCGECIKVCPTNGLQPCLFEAGIYGFYTPKLIPQIGYCDYNCNLCTQICPTGAISKLSLEEKRQFIIGKAFIEPSYCLAYKGIDCLICQKVCPVAEKAIKYRKLGKIKQPYVISSLCIGCGTCENKCPVIENKAIKILTRNIKS